MKTTLLALIVSTFFSIVLFASDQPVDLKIEIEKAIEVKSVNDSSQTQMWVSVICAIVTVSGALLGVLISRNTALKTIEKQAKKTFDLQNRQHFLNVLRESIVDYLSIVSKSMLIARLDKEFLPDDNLTGIITAQTNLILMLNPDKPGNEEIITEIMNLTRLTTSTDFKEFMKAPKQYKKLELVLRNLLTNKWERIKAS